MLLQGVWEHNPLATDYTSGDGEVGVGAEYAAWSATAPVPFSPTARRDPGRYLLERRRHRRAARRVLRAVKAEQVPVWIFHFRIPRAPECIERRQVACVASAGQFFVEIIDRLPGRQGELQRVAVAALGRAPSRVIRSREFVRAELEVLSVWQHGYRVLPALAGNDEAKTAIERQRRRHVTDEEVDAPERQAFGHGRILRG